MKTVALAVAAISAITTATGTHAANIQPLIVGGTVVPAGTKTCTVGLRQTAAGSNFCGGSLLSPTHVLTAAHCLEGKPAFVSVGSHFLSGVTEGERIAIKTKTVHPLFRSATLDHDFMILELATPSKFPPVKLYSVDSSQFQGSFATVMGWGRTTAGGPQSKVLLRVSQLVLSTEVCELLTATFPTKVTSAMLCAGVAPRMDSCQGDSGGPLILEQPTGDVLVGVVSWGDGCGSELKPGLYGRVSYVKDWIQKVAPNATFV